MVRPVNDGFNALLNKKYLFKTQYLETATSIEELLSKLKKRNDIDGYHVFRWDTGEQLL